MNVWYKPRLQSVDNIIKTQVLGGEVSPKQIDAVQEEALDVVLAALNGEAGNVWPGYPFFLCAALHFWRDELIERMRREHPDDLEAEKAAYIMMKRHYKGEAKKLEVMSNAPDRKQKERAGDGDGRDCRDHRL